MAPNNFVLIDYENIQPKNIEILKKHPFKIFVFVGENQNRIPFETANAIQEFGSDARYIKISGNGQNSLDFHIAFYVGQLSVQDPEGYFHIISKDTGFDPLIKHLRGRKVKVNRINDLAEIPVLRISNTIDKDEKINAIVKNIAGRGQSRPRKVTTLSNTINSLFTNKLDEMELLNIIKILQAKKYISLNKENVSYHLPKNL
ncbi:MAG: PIN domain-containing protein [Desulfobacteraceae bacterium]|nr:PIN domain-containing protein [Desulfobacteraceae bacterium]